MPPKARITRDMIIDAAVNVVRNMGPENINVRKVAAELNCSTQPVMYHFRTVEELKSEVFLVTRNMHNEFVLGITEDDSDAEDKVQDFFFLASRFVKFAAEEPSIFRFVFQSGRLKSGYLTAMFGTASEHILTELSEKYSLDRKQAEMGAAAVAASVYGYAGLIANGFVKYDAELADKSISKAVSSVAVWKD